MIAHTTTTTTITVSTNLGGGKQNKKKKDKIEMVVIDEKLIKDSVKEFNDENNILIKGDIILSSLMVLSLSFRNIWKIQNLQGLERLQKLQLDNNYIETIESLDHLLNLKWLDLSFNNIKEIKGLEKLKNLQDLSLFSNFITKIENLDGCPLLNVFSIGNNKLENYESLISTFRGSKFKHLQVLNVAGNPFTSKESDYKQHLIFNLINLKYLDYVFIDQAMRSEISEQEKFRNQLSYQESLSKALQNEEDEEKEHQKKKKAMEESKMDLLEKFHEELAVDMELERIRSLKGIEDEINKFKDKIKETFEALQKNILPKNDSKIQDIDKFLTVLRQREQESENKTIEILREFEHDKKIIFRMMEPPQKPNWREKMIELSNKTLVTKEKLLNLEVSLMDDLHDLTEEFRNKTLKVTQEMEKMIGDCFARIKDEIIIKEFYPKINSIAMAECDRYSAVQQSGGSVEEWNEEQLSLIENREALAPVVGNIKENIGNKADKKDTETQNAIRNEMANFIADIKDRQYERNRRNVLNIHEKIKEYIAEIEEKLTGEESESDKE